MIYLKESSGQGRIPFGMALKLGENIFLEARNLFHRFPCLRNQTIPVFNQEGKAMPFSLGWKKNFTANAPAEIRKNLPIIVSDFWEYDLCTVQKSFPPGLSSSFLSSI